MDDGGLLSGNLFSTDDSTDDDRDVLQNLSGQAIAIGKASPPDEAYDIAPQAPPQHFEHGPTSPDWEAMSQQWEEALAHLKEHYPQIKVMMGSIQHKAIQGTYHNTHGVRYTWRQGLYDTAMIFSAKEGIKVSSLNYTLCSTSQLTGPLLERGGLPVLLEQTMDQLNPKAIEDKFVGDVIISPHCLDSFLSFLVNLFLSDDYIIAGRGFLKDKLHEDIASSKFSLHSWATREELGPPAFVTDDGHQARDMPLVDRGKLKNFALSLYGANKTGRNRLLGPRSNLVVDGGHRPWKDLISSVERGILLNGYSGSAPNDAGDFSGVAKNSYYIEEGKIQYPLTETMVSGNLGGLLKNIQDTSRERIHFGTRVLPWCRSKDLTIS